MAGNSPLEKFLSAELLTLDKDWFCLSCNSCKETINNTSIIQSAPVLVTSLKHSCVERDKVIKDNQFFKSLPEDLRIRITDNNKVSFLSNYSLVATINHSGNLNNGHYWAIIKDVATNQRFSCNDKVVFEIKTADLKTSYVLFFVKKNFFFSFDVAFVQEGFLNSDIVFGCDNSKFNPSSVRILSWLTQYSY